MQGGAVRAVHPNHVLRARGRAKCVLSPSSAGYDSCLGDKLCGTENPGPQDKTVSIYIVEHGLVDFSPTARKPLQLTEEGLHHKDAVTAAMSGIPLTDVFASHTLRSRQTVEGAAAAHSLAVVQLPVPGSVLDGQTVTDETPRNAAVQPVSEALLHLKKGSNALYAGNTENIYAILSNLGVPVIAGCKTDSMCVPCTDKTCFNTSDMKALWHLTISQHEPVTLGYQKTYLNA